jgi:protocatechuate 3,4-dioxygenase beta subunit
MRIPHLSLALVAAATLLSGALASPALAQSTVGTTETLTRAQTEGPYFKTNSPERTSLVDDGVQGTLLTITGTVLTPDGTPVANALLDFWQANASGAYDNSGYTLRGHQYTDANGNYTLTTIVPGLYPGRTRHVHVKVQAPGSSSVLTTQLYFPGEARNNTDGIFDPSLVLNTQANPDGSDNATFNFVVNA